MQGYTSCKANLAWEVLLGLWGHMNFNEKPKMMKTSSKKRVTNFDSQLAHFERLSIEVQTFNRLKTQLVRATGDQKKNIQVQLLNQFLWLERELDLLYS